MRRAAVLALPVVALLGIGALLWLRRTSDLPGDAATTVSGTVTGRYGTVWNVRIEARDGERVLAGTWTNYKGLYSLDVPPGVRFDLLALPIDLTCLVAQAHPMTLRRGEKRVLDFPLRTIDCSEGTFVGEPTRRSFVGLRAVSDEAPSVVASVYGERFVFWRTKPGALYRIEASDWGWEQWDLESPVTFRGGDGDIQVRLKHVLRVRFQVRDVVSGGPVGSFRVEILRPDGRVFANLEGKDGLVRWQTPYPEGERPWDWPAHVRADGYFDGNVSWGLGRADLQPLRDPNVTLRVQSLDGTSYAGELAVNAWAHRDNRFVSLDLHLRTTEAGREAALPPGKWRISVRPARDFTPVQCDLTVPEDGPVVVDVPRLERMPVRR